MASAARDKLSAAARRSPKVGVAYKLAARRGGRRALYQDDRFSGTSRHALPEKIMENQTEFWP